MNDFKKIKNKLKKNYRYFWYFGTKKKVILISKSKTKKESKQLVYQKINSKPNKFKGADLIYIKMGFHLGTKILQGGPISANVSIFKVNDKLKIRDNSLPAQIGNIWFTQSFIERWGWKYTYLKKIVELVYWRKIKIYPGGVTDYTSIKSKN